MGQAGVACRNWVGPPWGGDVPTGQYRVLLLGPAVAGGLGLGVCVEDVFVQRMDRLWSVLHCFTLLGHEQKLLAPSRDAARTVVHLGSQGHSPGQQWRDGLIGGVC